MSLSPQAVAAKIPELDAIISAHLAAWASAAGGSVPLAASCKLLGLALGVDVMSGIPLREENRALIKQLCTEFNDGEARHLPAATPASVRCTVCLSDAHCNCAEGRKWQEMLGLVLVRGMRRRSRRRSVTPCPLLHLA